MNRFIYILTLLSIILSCSKHELKEDDVASSQDKVELRFSVTVPGEEVASKALGINPKKASQEDIENKVAELEAFIKDNGTFIKDYGSILNNPNLAEVVCLIAFSSFT